MRRKTFSFLPSKGSDTQSCKSLSKAKYPTDLYPSHLHCGYMTGRIPDCSCFSINRGESFIKKTPLKDYKDYFSLLFRVLVFAVFTGASVLHHSISSHASVKIWQSQNLHFATDCNTRFWWNQQAIDMKMQIISLYHNTYVFLSLCGEI